MCASDSREIGGGNEVARSEAYNSFVCVKVKVKMCAASLWEFDSPTPHKS